MIRKDRETEHRQSEEDLNVVLIGERPFLRERYDGGKAR